MVSVLAIGPNVEGFKPGGVTPSFGGEVKPEAPCHKILWHVKDLYKVRKGYFIDKIHHFLCPNAPDLLLDDSVGRIAREHSGG
jgi:hypothetical protein